MEKIENKIDHTLLNADAKESDIKRLCKEAKNYGFYSVCVNPSYLTLAKRQLLGTDVKLCTVIGFPLGANDWRVKAYEAELAILNGADEIDFVMNIGMLKSNNMKALEEEISGLMDRLKGRASVKMILETCYLERAEIECACHLAIKYGVNFVKTSTGFGSDGAKLEDVMFMKSIVKDHCLIKASGGIRDRDTAIKFLKAGANRLGTSQSCRIVNEGEKI